MGNDGMYAVCVIGLLVSLLVQVILASLRPPYQDAIDATLASQN